MSGLKKSSHVILRFETNNKMKVAGQTFWLVYHDITVFESVQKTFSVTDDLYTRAVQI